MHTYRMSVAVDVARMLNGELYHGFACYFLHISRSLPLTLFSVHVIKVKFLISMDNIWAN